MRIVIVAAVLVAGAMARSILAAPVERLVVIVPDDAFYYLQIAYAARSRRCGGVGRFSVRRTFPPSGWPTS